MVLLNPLEFGQLSSESVWIMQFSNRLQNTRSDNQGLTLISDSRSGNRASLQAQNITFCEEKNY